MSLLNIGVSGLLAHQATLRTTGHNISNADTEGYSRQRVDTSTQTPHYTGAGYQGSGVQVDRVRRVVDDFVVNQLRLDSSAFKELDSYRSNIEQVDSLLADLETGLAPGMQAFFSALHTVADDPTAIPVRQLVISQAEGLAQRFDVIHGRLEQHNRSINQQLGTVAGEITSLAAGIASLNDSISLSSGAASGDGPNDLLDKRDEMLRKMSELVSVTIAQKANGTVDVFVGNGQGLVEGNRAGVLQVLPGESDPAKNDLVFTNGRVEQRVTSLIKGGELGGILNFRDEILTRTMNNVGRLAISISAAVNEQHQLGLDMDGLFGGLFFSDVNGTDVAHKRVVPHADNLSGNETRLGVTIEDTGLLTDADYVLSFPGPGAQRYSLTRVDNQAVVQTGVLAGVLPNRIEIDGFAITVESGEIREGDRFLIQPTRSGGRDIAVEVDLPERLAIASAVNAQASLGNNGSVKILNTEALDVTTDAFSIPGTLAPPLVIRFTSPTTYDVLDNTNPAKPADLVPPIRNLAFTPGIENQMLPGSPEQTSASSAGFLAGRVPTAFTRESEGPSDNGYVEETLTVTTTDPATGTTTDEIALTVGSGESALSVSQRLSAMTGVRATARTQVQLDQFLHGADGREPMAVTINGVRFEQTATTELTPNDLADRINADPAFVGTGLVARSNGETLTLESRFGDDITVAISGDREDQFVMRDQSGNELVMHGAGAGNGHHEATVGGVIDVYMEAGIRLRSSTTAADGNLFLPEPVARSTFLGYQVTMDGVAQAGDRFTVEFNAGGISDNRNGVALTSIEGRPILEGSRIDLGESYGRLVEIVGARTAQSQVNSEASGALLLQSQLNRDSIAGVNLDEEAADLIRFEQAYNASAQVISVARSLFDTLISTFR